MSRYTKRTKYNSLVVSYSIEREIQTALDNYKIVNPDIVCSHIVNAAMRKYLTEELGLDVKECGKKELPVIESAYKKNISATIDGDVYDKLNGYCNDRGIYRSKVVNACLKDFFTS